MVTAADPITFSVPRDMLTGIVTLSDEMTDRMHQLLERNTDGRLTPAEKEQLEALVRIAQFSQIVSMALLQPTSLP